MRFAETTPLTADELNTLHALMQRWILGSYPAAYDGENDESYNAVEVYNSIKADAKLGFQRFIPKTDDDKKDLKGLIAAYGEKNLP